MKKLVILLLLIVTLTGCKTNITDDALKFKEEYESLNGVENSQGKIHRTVSIDEDNPFVYITTEELLKRQENGENYYVYFGSKLCPWCRSIIEKVIEVAKKNDIKTIYYVDIWDDEGNEILRDQYIYDDDTIKLNIEGTEDYYELLEVYNDVLPDYVLTDEEGNTIITEMKRIYAPYLIYVENGVAIKSTDATSSKLEDSRAELTDEILQEEEEKLNEFFDN